MSARGPVAGGADIKLSDALEMLVIHGYRLVLNLFTLEGTSFNVSGSTPYQ